MQIKLKFAIVSTVLWMLLCVNIATAGQVTLAWDANEPVPEGYRIYVRDGLNYDYTAPAWSGPATSATVDLPEGKTYYFVVRAFKGVLESGDSAEVNYTMPTDGISSPDNPKIEKVVVININ